MKLRTAFRLGMAALRSVQYLLGGDIRFPQERLGEVLEMPEGDRFVVYRETALRPAVVDTPEEGALLIFRMHVPNRHAGESVREVLFDPLANVSTPFFSGMPGFRRKLWLAGRRPGEFLELYEFASVEDADRFAEVFRSLLEPFSFAGSASFEVVEDDSIEEFVAARSASWLDTADQHEQPNRWRSLGLPLLAVGVLLVGVYLLLKYGPRSEQTDQIPPSSDSAAAEDT